MKYIQIFLSVQAGKWMIAEALARMDCVQDAFAHAGFDFLRDYPCPADAAGGGLLADAIGMQKVFFVSAGICVVTSLIFAPYYIRRAPMNGES